MIRCDFAVHVTEHLLIIEDLDIGGMSVTNDIENVIAEIAKSYDLKKREVVYVDSMGIYTLIDIIDNKFYKFWKDMSRRLYIRGKQNDNE